MSDDDNDNILFLSIIGNTNTVLTLKNQFNALASDNAVSRNRGGNDDGAITQYNELGPAYIPYICAI